MVIFGPLVRSYGKANSVIRFRSCDPVSAIADLASVISFDTSEFVFGSFEGLRDHNLHEGLRDHNLQTLENMYVANLRHVCLK